MGCIKDYTKVFACSKASSSERFNLSWLIERTLSSPIDKVRIELKEAHSLLSRHARWFRRQNRYPFQYIYDLFDRYYLLLLQKINRRPNGNTSFKIEKIINVQQFSAHYRPLYGINVQLNMTNLNALNVEYKRYTSHTKLAQYDIKYLFRHKPHYITQFIIIKN